VVIEIVKLIVLINCERSALMHGIKESVACLDWSFKSYCHATETWWTLEKFLQCKTIS